MRNNLNFQQNIQAPSHTVWGFFLLSQMRTLLVFYNKPEFNVKLGLRPLVNSGIQAEALKQ